VIKSIEKKVFVNGTIDGYTVAAIDTVICVAQLVLATHIIFSSIENE